MGMWLPGHGAPVAYFRHSLPPGMPHSKHSLAAVNGQGCRGLVFKIQDWLDAHPASISAADPEVDPASAQCDEPNDDEPPEEGDR